MSLERKHPTSSQSGCKVFFLFFEHVGTNCFLHQLVKIAKLTHTHVHMNPELSYERTDHLRTSIYIAKANAMENEMNQMRHVETHTKHLDSSLR